LIVVGVVTGVEVLIATPNKLLSLMNTSEDSDRIYPHQPFISLAKTRTLILDEVDALFADESFSISPIGDAVSAARTLSPQFVFVTATLTKQTQDVIQSEFGVSVGKQGSSRSAPSQAANHEHADNEVTIDESVKVLKGPGLHKIAPYISFSDVIDCSQPLKKDSGTQRRIHTHGYDEEHNDPNNDHSRPVRLGQDDSENDDDEDDYDDYDGNDLDHTMSTRNRPRGHDANPRRRPGTHNRQQHLDYVVNNKCAALIKLLENQATDSARTVVFCNSIPSCRAVENALNRANARRKERFVLAEPRKNSETDSFRVHLLQSARYHLSIPWRY
jgi:hypothetical protein